MGLHEESWQHPERRTRVKGRVMVGDGGLGVPKGAQGEGMAIMAAGTLRRQEDLDSPALQTVNHPRIFGGS